VKGAAVHGANRIVGIFLGSKKNTQGAGEVTVIKNDREIALNEHNMSQALCLGL
jgi:hypothetical protein